MKDQNPTPQSNHIPPIKSKATIVFIATILLVIAIIIVLVSPSLATLTFGITFTMILVAILSWSILQ